MKNKKEMKDFIIIGNKNSLFLKDIFPLFMEGGLRYGYNYINYFLLSDNAEKWKKMEGGKKLNDFQGTGRWFSSFPVHKKNPPLPLLPYDPRVHRKYDTYDAVNTDSIHNIPNYDGLIGVPIGIIGYLCPEQFEIVGKLMNGACRYDYGKPIVDGKKLYVRILIKKK